MNFILDLGSMPFLINIWLSLALYLILIEEILFAVLSIFATKIILNILFPALVRGRWGVAWHNFLGLEGLLLWLAFKVTHYLLPGRDRGRSWLLLLLLSLTT